MHIQVHVYRHTHGHTVRRVNSSRCIFSSETCYKWHSASMLTDCFVVYSYHKRIMQHRPFPRQIQLTYAIGIIWNCQYSTALTFINSNTVAHASNTPLCEHEPWPCFGQWSMKGYDGCHLLSEALTPCPLKGRSSARVLDCVLEHATFQGDNVR